MSFADENRAIDLVGEARRARTELHERVEERVAREKERLRSTTKTRKSAETRKRIMNITTQLMVERGNTAFRMSEISRRCGMSKGALYYYFSDKEDLVRTIFEGSVDDLVAGVDAVAASADTPEEALLGISGEFARRADESAFRPKSLRQRPYRQIGPFATEELRRTVSRCPKHPDGMGVVDERKGVVSRAQVENLRQRRDIAIHRKDSVACHESPSVATAKREFSRKVVHVAMTINDDLRAGQPATVYDGSVVELVGKNDISLASHRGYCAYVGHVACCVENRSFAAEEGR